MKPDQQNEMIRSMVARLADKLKADGSDVAGWERLLRAYMVLGDHDKAMAAAADARKALAERPGQASPARCGDQGFEGRRLSAAAQLSLAPSRIQARMSLRSQELSCFMPCGMRSSGDARQSSSSIRLLLSGSPGMTMGPNLVPFMTPA